MGFSNFLLLSFFCCSFMTTIAENCLESSILPVISFPCSNCRRPAYPGFSMSCTEANRAVIQLGSWGEFLVRDVNYVNQEVEIYDQHNCLPKRLLNLDLSSTPFRGAHYENFTFYNCSSEFSSNVSMPISCLGTLNHTIFATSNASAMESFSTCDVIASVMIPSRSRYRTDINHLVWDTPHCKACVGELHGHCGFKKKGSLELECFVFLPPKQGFPKSAKFAYIIGIFICSIFGVPILVCFILIAWCLFETIRIYDSNNSNRVEHVETTSLIITTVGLDESVIQSYPETVLGESIMLANPDDYTCSICLSDYQAKETLKIIPDCKHCFHSTCIDEWLRQNVTCPICRNTMPLPA
ncbi:hypothetical protein ACHQM5_006014 [Ranunculus cassubicifolius]